MQKNIHEAKAMTRFSYNKHICPHYSVSFSTLTSVFVTIAEVQDQATLLMNAVTCLDVKCMEEWHILNISCIGIKVASTIDVQVCGLENGMEYLLQIQFSLQYYR